MDFDVVSIVELIAELINIDVTLFFVGEWDLPWCFLF